MATQLRSVPPYGRAQRLDVRDGAAVDRVLMRHGPEVVVHTAYVQGGPELERTVVRGSLAVAEAARRCDARLVHLSTDLVFDGEHGAPYDEDGRAPAGDGLRRREARGRAARGGANPEALLVRTSVLYGKPEPGAQELLAFRDDVEFYTDEIRCPTVVSELAAALLELAAAGRCRPAPRRCRRSGLEARARTDPAGGPRPRSRDGRGGLRAPAAGGRGTSRSTPRGPPVCCRRRASRRPGRIGRSAYHLLHSAYHFHRFGEMGPTGPFFLTGSRKHANGDDYEKEKKLESEIAPRVEHDLPGVEVLAVELASPERFVVYVDHPEGVDHELCVRVTDLLRDYLREYTVDVSSPGTERPLRKPSHFARALGHKVALRTARADRGPVEVQGRVEGRRRRRRHARRRRGEH